MPGRGRPLRRRPRRAPRVSLRSGLIILSCISLVLLGGAVYLFTLLAEGRRTLDDSAREDALWAAYQTDKELGRLVQTIGEVLISDNQSGIDVIRLAYDITYSRATLLENGYFDLRFDDSEGLGRLGREVGTAILALVPLIDALPAEGLPVERPALMALLRQTQAIQERAAALVRETNQSMNALRVARRAETRGLQTTLGINVGLLVAGFAGIVTLLMLQMRQIAKTGRKLALLGRRNRAIAMRARAANRAKSTFLATMSHEIRTPLNGIIGASELLAGTPLSREQGRQLCMIRQSGDLLLEVITDVLDFSKLESGAVDFQIERVRLPDVADTLQAVLAGRAERKGIALSVELPRIELGTDPTRLRQLLVNLAGNAVKFTDCGAVRVTGFLLGQSMLRIEITDTGIGIPAAAVSGLFREFNQVDGSASRRFGGTGLGLAICKRIVTGMGGQIGVHSREGEGSTFWFELPVHPPVLAVEAAAPPLGRGAPAGPPTSLDETFLDQATTSGGFRGKVLLVEDNPINSAVAEGLLVRLGVSVSLAENGATAVDLVTSDYFDIVFMDMQMPILNGIDATRLLRSQGNTTRIVGLTGNTFASDRTACLRAGMNDFIAKPVTTAKLSAALVAAGLHHNPSPGILTGPAPSPPRRIDIPLLDGLREAVGDEILDSLLVALEAEARILPEALTASVADADQVDALLHSLKGAAATLGLSAAAEEVQALRAPGADPGLGVPLVSLAVCDDIALVRQYLAQGLVALRVA